MGSLGKLLVVVIVFSLGTAIITGLSFATVVLAPVSPIIGLVGGLACATFAFKKCQKSGS